MARGVDAPVESVKAPDGNPLPDRARTKAKVSKLVEGHDAVLCARKLGDRSLEPLGRASATVRDYACRFVAFAGHGVIVPGSDAPFTTGV